jgi:ubiquinone/menaquinone biosynthesis C-methylase UbiE
MKKKNLAKYLLLAAAPAGLAVGAAVAYAEYRKQRLDQESSKLWELLALKPGSRVADIGAGVGELTGLMASRIGPLGRIYAVEADPGKLRRLHRRKQRAQWTNVEIISASPDNCNLPENSCDAIYMRGVYHHLTNPAAMDASLLRALRPGGTLAVVDFAPRILLAPWTPKGIPSDRGGHGIRRELTTAELEQAGFDAVRTVETWPGGCYCVLFQKPTAA